MDTVDTSAVVEFLNQDITIQDMPSIDSEGNITESDLTISADLTKAAAGFENISRLLPLPIHSGDRVGESNGIMVADESFDMSMPKADGLLFLVKNISTGQTIYIGGMLSSGSFSLSPGQSAILISIDDQWLKF